MAIVRWYVAGVSSTQSFGGWCWWTNEGVAPAPPRAVWWEIPRQTWWPTSRRCGLWWAWRAGAACWVAAGVSHWHWHMRRLTQRGTLSLIYLDMIFRVNHILPLYDTQSDSYLYMSVNRRSSRNCLIINYVSLYYNLYSV